MNTNQSVNARCSNMDIKILPVAYDKGKKGEIKCLEPSWIQSDNLGQPDLYTVCF